MYFQPIKNEDPHLDFYTVYKREATEYDTEHVKRYNEELNITLIFVRFYSPLGRMRHLPHSQAGLFSAVSSVFVLDVQSKLEPDSSKRSEAYLRAILLSLNRSVAPNEHPAAPPAWDGPPTEAITTSDLLYGSLLVSLLAAFAAMLSKQWLNLYLRHAGGSMIERCGDRQRKFDGLEKWPFHLFIESLSIMLQIALLLLTCGLSLHMWSINTSVARVVVTFTVLGFFFYVGIVVAGTSSHYCPFQTPASTTLRALRDRGVFQKLFARLSLVALRDSLMPQNSLANPSVPRVISFIRATRRLARRGLVLVHGRVFDAARNPPPLDVSLSSVAFGVCHMGTMVGRIVVILFLYVYRTLRNTTWRLVLEIRRHKRTPLPTILTAAHHQLRRGQRGGLLVSPRNLENLRKQNADNTRCVSWILRNITDPEATDSALRLASTVRWFEGDIDINPPYDVILFSFQGCFDPNNVLYPGMKDRAFISGKALLQIHTCAALRADKSKYPIPESPWGCTPTGVLHFAAHVNSSVGKDISETPANLLWMSALLVTIARLPPITLCEPLQGGKDIPCNSRGKLGTSRAMDGNTLLAWYLILGGRAEEETFWADDKSYVMFVSSFGLFKTTFTRDLVGAILPFLSRAIVDAIPVTDQWDNLYELLEQLMEWKERPACLIAMAYQWSLAFCDCIRNIDQLLAGPTNLASRRFEGLVEPHDGRVGIPKREYVLECCLLLLALSLGVGFRHGPGGGPTRMLPVNEEHHLLIVETMLKGASRGTQIAQKMRILYAGIEGALHVWTLGMRPPPLGSCATYLGGIIKGQLISPDLRVLLVRAIGSMEYDDLERAGLETIVDALCDLNLRFDDVCAGGRWPSLLKPLIRSHCGRERLPLRYWHLLEGLVMDDVDPQTILCQPDVDAMRALEASQDWEKLEVWMRVLWISRLEGWFPPVPVAEDIERVTLSLFQRRPSALSGFACMKIPFDRSRSCLLDSRKAELQQICESAT